MINTGWVIEILMNMLNPWMAKAAQKKFKFFNDESYKAYLQTMIPVD
jgi:hypothetical protein